MLRLFIFLQSNKRSAVSQRTVCVLLPLGRTSFLRCFHQTQCPLRVIVSEGGTWQVQVSRFLQRHLIGITSDGPFSVRSSNEIVHVLQMGMPNTDSAFSSEVEDLLYSVPHGGLFNAVLDKSIYEEKLGFKILRVLAVTAF